MSNLPMEQTTQSDRPRTSLRRRILTGNTVIIVLLLLAAVLVLWQVSRLLGTIDELQAANDRTIIVAETRQQSTELLVTISRLLPLEDADLFAEEVGAILDDLSQNQAELDVLAETVDDPAIAASLENVNQEVSSLLGIGSTMIRQAQLEQWPSVAIRVGVLTRDQQELSAEVADLFTLVEGTAEEAADDVAAARRDVVIYPGLVVLLTLVLWPFLVNSVVQSVAGPVEALSSSAARLAAGEFGERVPVSGEDEMGQLARSFNRMAEQLAASYDVLEQRVQERTADLALAAEVGQTLSRVRDVDELLHAAVDQIRDRFDLYYVQVYLLDPSGKNLAIRAGTGRVGDELVRRGFRLPVDYGSINGSAAVDKEAVIISNTEASTLFRPNPLLPETRSEMAVPLMLGDRVLGVLDLQSDTAGSLTEDVLPAFTVLAGELAIAIDNARLLEEANSARQELERQAQRRASEGWSAYLNAIERGERIGFVHQGDRVDALADSLSAVGAGRNVLSAPIALNNEPIGAIELEADPDVHWNETQIELLNAVADQVAQQVENLRLLAESERYQREAEAAVRRATREGWEAYGESGELGQQTYLYDGEQVRSAAQTSQKSAGNGELSQLLVVQGEPVGELLVVDDGDLPETASNLMATVASGLSAHLDSLRLNRQTEIALASEQRQRRIADTLVRATSRMMGVLDETRIREVMVDEIENLIQPDQITLYEYVQPGDQLLVTTRRVPAYGESEDHYEVGQLIGREERADLWRVIGEAEPILEVLEQPGDYVREHYRLPWSVGDEVAGVIEAYHTARGATIREEDQTSIAGIVQQAAIRLQNARLLEQTRKRAVELETVARVSAAASTILDSVRLLQSVVELTRRSFDLYHAHIYLLSEDAQYLVLAAGAGEAGERMVEEEWRIPLDANSIVARAARDRQGVIVDDVREAVDFLPNPHLPDTRSELAVPMIAGNRLLGVMDVQSEHVNNFTPDDVNIQSALANQVAIALQNANLYQEQLQTTEKLRELDRLKSEFLASMSHELRTPLNSIIGFADVLLEGIDGELTDRMEEDVMLIRNSGQHLRELIGDILDMSKIEAGMMELHYEHITVTELVRDLEAFARSEMLVYDRDLEFVVEIAEDIDTVQADRTRFRQILYNLISNAVKFTREGRVTVSIASRNNDVVVTVSDTGIGIADDDLRVIFEQFRQVDGSLTRSAGGTGLGLPISKSLVELHGGDIWVDSQVDKGTKFSFTLPAQHPYTRSMRTGSLPSQN